MQKIAYCPTMAPYVQDFRHIEGLDFFNMGSAAQAFMSYLSGQTDAVLVGRVANKREIDDKTVETRFKEGLTLVYRQKIGVDKDELKNITVLTYLDENRTAAFNDMFAKIERKPDIDACLEDDLQTPLLLDWQDFRDDFQLLIPMDQNGKVALFRAPVLYHRGISAEILDKMKQKVR